MIKHLHCILKSNTSDEKTPLTPVGEFKTSKNVIGAFNQINITDPKNVESEIEGLLKYYQEREHSKNNEHKS